MELTIRCVQDDNGEIFVYVDGSLMGVYADWERAGVLIGEEFALRIAREKQFNEDEED